MALSVALLVQKQEENVGCVGGVGVHAGGLEQSLKYLVQALLKSF